MIKRILYITPEFPPKIGGISSISEAFTNAYKEKGLIVDIFTPGTLNSNKTVNFIKTENWLLKLVKPLSKKLKISNYLIWLNLNIKIFIRTLINHIKYKYDLIETHDYYALGVFIFFNKWLFNLFHKVKFIVRISGPMSIIKSKYYFEDKLENRLIFDKELPLIKSADIVSFPSESMIKLIEERIGEIKIKIKVLPPIINELNKHKTSKSNYLIYVGRIQDGKGVEYLIKSWLELPRQIKKEYSLRLIGNDTVIKGDKSFKDYLIKKYNLDSTPSIILKNALSHSDTINEMSQSRGVIIPSIIENYPTVALEAIILNKPIIGTINTGVEDIIRDFNYQNFLPIKSEELFSSEIANLIDYKEVEFNEKYYEIIKDSFAKYLDQISQ